MFTSKNAISISAVVNGQTKTFNAGDYIVQVEYQYNKLWGDDTGRNLAGTFSGTLKGTFPKIVLQFKALTQTQLETIAPILDSARQNVTYYDPYKKANVTMTTYTGDYTIINKNIIGDNGSKNEGFSVSFIPVSKRV